MSTAKFKAAAKATKTPSVKFDKLPEPKVQKVPKAAIEQNPPKVDRNERDKTILSMFKSGTTITEIAKAFDISEGYTKGILRNQGVHKFTAPKAEKPKAEKKTEKAPKTEKTPKAEKTVEKKERKPRESKQSRPYLALVSQNGNGVVINPIKVGELNIDRFLHKLSAFMEEMTDRLSPMIEAIDALKS